MVGGMAENFWGMKLGISKYFRTKFGISSMNTKKDTKFGKIAFKKTTCFCKKSLTLQIYDFFQAAFYKLLKIKIIFYILKNKMSQHQLSYALSSKVDVPSNFEGIPYWDLILHTEMCGAFNRNL